MQKPIYLDYNASTPTDPHVVECMLPYFTEHFGNSANHLHFYGNEAQRAVDQATEKVAQFLNCKIDEITWNSGSTEGNNTVIFGLIKKLQAEKHHQPIHFITSQTEHSSVLNSIKEIEKYPEVTVSYVKPDAMGFIHLGEIKKLITSNTKLISITWVNNEIGTINAIPEIASYCFENNIKFHTDATQALGKVNVDLKKIPIDYLTFSAHKFYGPKGVGVLFQRNGEQIPALIFGGGHQHNRRSGTLNTPGIVGTAKAIELCSKHMYEENSRCRQMTQKIYSELLKSVPELKLNGAPIGENRSPINLSLTFSIPIDSKLSQLKNLAFSQGAACKSGQTAVSAILTAIGLNTLQSSCTIRLSLGRWTTPNDVDTAILILSQAFKTQENMIQSNL